MSRSLGGGVGKDGARVCCRMESMCRWCRGYVAVAKYSCLWLCCPPAKRACHGHMVPFADQCLHPFANSLACCLAGRRLSGSVRPPAKMWVRWRQKRQHGVRWRCGPKHRWGAARAGRGWAGLGWADEGHYQRCPPRWCCLHRIPLPLARHHTSSSHCLSACSLVASLSCCHAVL